MRICPVLSVWSRMLGVHLARRTTAGLKAEAERTHDRRADVRDQSCVGVGSGHTLCWVGRLAFYDSRACPAPGFYMCLWFWQGYNATTCPRGAVLGLALMTLDFNADDALA